MNVCKPVKQKFQEWNQINTSLYQSLIMDQQKLASVWKDGGFQSDPSCHYHNEIHYSIRHGYVCKSCRTIDQIGINGKIEPNETFEVDCLNDNHLFVLEEYPNVAPYIQVKGNQIVADPVTKQYLINILLQPILQKYLQKYYTMYHCGNNIYILKEDSLFPVQKELFYSHPDYAIGIWIQLFFLCQRLTGLFHGAPLLENLRIRDKDWHKYNFTVCVDGFQKSRIYTPELQISSQGQLPIIGRDRIAVETRDDGNWIYLSDSLLQRMFVDGIEYVPTLDFYGFILSLVSHLDMSRPEYKILKDWFYQLFRTEQIEQINISSPITTTEQLRQVLKGIWIHPDFKSFDFEIKK